MERLRARLLTVTVLALGLMSGCSSPIRDGLDPRFSQAVTALWITSYQEDSQTHRFVRTSAWGQVPEKLVPDGEGGYSVAVPLLLQTETSDGPAADRFWTVLVRVIRLGDEFTLVPNDALPGGYQKETDAARRTVWFVGKTWQFQGRY